MNSLKLKEYSCNDEKREDEKRDDETTLEWLSRIVERYTKNPVLRSKL